MRQGTTPTHYFTLPFDVSLVADAMIIYAQNNVEIFNKGLRDCTLAGNEISVRLSQEDTFRFDHTKNVQIQLRLLTTDDQALASDIYVVSVARCLNDEVL